MFSLLRRINMKIIVIGPIRNIQSTMDIDRRSFKIEVGILVLDIGC